MKKNRKWENIKGFTLIEIIVVIAVIGIISSIILVAFLGVRERARDAKRKTEISQFGRLLTLSCYLPDGGEGEYDLISLVEELKSKYSQYDQYLSNIPQDPKTGSESESKYIYIVNADGTKCALYANLENTEEPVTLTITVPTAGGGTGVLEAGSPGWNGTPFYFQYSN